MAAQTLSTLVTQGICAHPELPQLPHVVFFSLSTNKVRLYPSQGNARLKHRTYAACKDEFRRNVRSVSRQIHVFFLIYRCSMILCRLQYCLFFFGGERGGEVIVFRRPPAPPGYESQCCWNFVQGPRRAFQPYKTNSTLRDGTSIPSIGAAFQ